MRRLRGSLLTLALGAVLLVSGCLIAPPWWRSEANWRAEVLYPSAALAPSRASRAGHAIAETGFNLYLITRTVGISFATADEFLRTLHKHPRGGKHNHTIGHSWLILESPEEMLEGGHTGEYGVDAKPYYDGVLERIVQRDPDPIGYLWQSLPDGRFHTGPDGHLPTFALRVPLTPGEHAAIRRFINEYDFHVFSLRDQQCTDFVAGAADLAGIHVAHRVRLWLPPKAYYRGRVFRVWTDPRYAMLDVGSPDILEQELRRLAALGAGEDATQWYLH